MYNNYLQYSGNTYFNILIHRSHTTSDGSTQPANTKRLMMYLIPVLTTAFLFNIPKFLESKTAEGPNGTLKIDTTDLRENPYYAVYYSSLGRGFVLSFIPSLLLVWLNYKIYRVMKSQPNFLDQQSFRAKEFQIKRRKQENNLAVLMSVISVVFIACHLLRNFLNAYEITVIQRNEQCKAAGKHTFTRWSMICSQFSNLLLVFNSSTNMILYCIMNKHFRTDFLLIVKTMILCLTCRTVKCRDSGETSQQNSQQHDNVNVIPETAETNV